MIALLTRIAGWFTGPLGWLLTKLLGAAVDRAVDAYKKSQEQKAHDKAVEKDIERAATKYDDTVKKGEAVTREERRKDVEDVLNSGG